MNRIAGSKSVLGGNSVRGEAQVEQFCSWGGVGRRLKSFFLIFLKNLALRRIGGWAGPNRF